MATQVRLIKHLLILIILWGCSAQPSLWITDSIAAGDISFNSSRIRYVPKQAHPPLSFEMTRIGGQIDAYLSLNRFRFKTSENVKVNFSFANESFTDLIPIHQGGMKIRLSSETTEKLINALQEGHKIVILLDDFQETLDPAQFSGTFAKFVGETNFFQNIFRGPIP